MELEELRSLAQAEGIIRANSFCTRKNLIRAIQRERDQRDCFMTDERFLCHDVNCEWKNDCKRLVAEWLRW
jgi:hypothetical protein